MFEFPLSLSVKIKGFSEVVLIWAMGRSAVARIWYILHKLL